MRTAEIKRKTKETDIEVFVKLDGEGKVSVNTGIGFFAFVVALFFSVCILETTFFTALSLSPFVTFAALDASTLLSMNTISCILVEFVEMINF